MQSLRDLATYYATCPPVGSSCVVVNVADDAAVVHFRCLRRSYRVEPQAIHVLQETLAGDSGQLSHWYRRRAESMSLLVHSYTPGHLDCGYVAKDGGVWRGVVLGEAVSVDMAD